MTARRKPVALVSALLGSALVVVALVGCDDKKEQLRAATTPADAGVPSATPIATTTPPSASPSAAPAPSASEDAKRFDPKHKCPTGQTHFYLEGDFCRRKCFTNADCAKKERCSIIEYPFVIDGGTAGMSKFCEGT